MQNSLRTSRAAFELVPCIQMATSRTRSDDGRPCGESGVIAVRVSEVDPSRITCTSGLHHEYPSMPRTRLTTESRIGRRFGLLRARSFETRVGPNCETLSSASQSAIAEAYRSPSSIVMSHAGSSWWRKRSNFPLVTISTCRAVTGSSRRLRESRSSLENLNGRFSPKL